MRRTAQIGAKGAARIVGEDVNNNDFLLRAPAAHGEGVENAFRRLNLSRRGELHVLYQFRLVPVEREDTGGGLKGGKTARRVRDAWELVLFSEVDSERELDAVGFVCGDVEVQFVAHFLMVDEQAVWAVPIFVVDVRAEGFLPRGRVGDFEGDVAKSGYPLEIVGQVDADIGYKIVVAAIFARAEMQGVVVRLARVRALKCFGHVHGGNEDSLIGRTCRRSNQSLRTHRQIQILN